MALFKICRGKESNLPSTLKDGYAYFCTDSRNFYIDWIDSRGSLTRSQLNSDCANKIRYPGRNGEYVEVDLVSYIDESIDTLRQEFLEGAW